MSLGNLKLPSLPLFHRPFKLRWLVWLALPLLLGWLAREVSLSDWLGLLSSIRVADLVALIALNVLAAFIFSSRWWLALLALGYRLPYLAVFQYRLAAFSVNYFTPGTQFGGEPLQVYALEKRHRMSRSDSVASVAVEKLFELLANSSFLVFGLALIVQNSLIPGSIPHLAVVCAVILLLIPLAYLAALGFGRQPLQALIRRFPIRIRTGSKFSQFDSLVQNTEAQVARLIQSNPRAVLWLLAASLLIWLVSILEYRLALSVFGAPLTLPQTIIALTAARLAFLTPLPAGLGALEAGQVLALQALGFGPAVGIAISLWIRLRDLVLGGSGLFFGALLVHSESILALSPETGD